MQYTITEPSKFKTIPWKNGKGKTVELAINAGATLDDFDWRLSMADVVEDGEFSDFSGYLRNLVLIKGEAITLVHDNVVTDNLESLLTFATFDGGCKTFGSLPSGPISDFNIITKNEKFDVAVTTFEAKEQVTLPKSDLLWVYSLSNEAIVTQEQRAIVNLPARHLLQINSTNNYSDLVITGQSLIIIALTHK